LILERHTLTVVGTNITNMAGMERIKRGKLRQKENRDLPKHSLVLAVPVSFLCFRDTCFVNQTYHSTDTETSGSDDTCRGLVQKHAKD